MAKRWIWLGLFLTAIAIVLLGWRGVSWLPGQANLSFQEMRPLDRASVPPDLDAERIFADVEALAFTRYTDADRSRARDYITKALEQAGWTPQTQPFAEGINLYATRSGTDADAGTILLAAHYDTVETSPGADDNATSVATVLEAARVLAKRSTAAALEVVFFDREEAGLLGSTAFVEQMQPDKNLRGAIVLDMVGYACRKEGCQSYPDLLPVTPPTTRGDFLAVIGDQGHPFLVDSFTAMNQPNLPQVLTLSIPTFGRLTPDLLRSDHVPFWQQGLGAVLVTDTANFRNPNYHQPTDTVTTIDRPFFLGAAQSVINATTVLLESQGG